MAQGNLSIKNNIFRGANAHANSKAIMINDADQGAADNIDIINNSIYDCSYGISIESVTATTNTKIMNNAMDGNGSAEVGIAVDTINSGVIDYNVVFDFTTAYSVTGSVSVGGNSFTTDPKFVSATDLLVQSDSPCIDAGVGNGTHSEVPTDDHRNVARPQDLGWGNVDDGTDIGAYEMEGAEVSFSSVSSDSSFLSFSSVSSESSESSELSESSSLSSSSDSSFSSEYLSYGSEVFPGPTINVLGGDVPVVSTIIVGKLLEFPSVASDPNFDSSAKWNTVTVIYEHSNGQNKKFVHREGAGSWTASGIFTTFANSGPWLKNRIILTDKEGDVLIVKRSEIGNDEDLTIIAS
jgi:hypothetical protein